MANKTLQQAIIDGMTRPSECDIILTLFWSRMGTPLDVETHGKKPNGEPYLSGTEWEYLDALNAAEATGTPQVVAYRRTEKVQEQLGMSNPDDIDDCMQAEYFKVWQLLQKQPDLFADKPKRYIVQAVVFRSKVQRFSHQRHYRKIVWDATTETRNADAPITRQIDTWIDLESALKTVGEYVAGLDNPIYLLALYALITQVTTRDVARLFGHGVSTLNKAKRWVRSTLAGELPDYGCLADTTKALCLSDGRQPPASKTGNGLIAEWVLSEVV